MEIAYRDYSREVGYAVGDSVFIFSDGAVIQDIHYSTKYGPRSLKKLKIKEPSC